MTPGNNMAEVAALVGDPSRANILMALIDGRALTATELAHIAGVTPATASGHLGKLLQGRLLALSSQGRHRYYRLASKDVAQMLEATMLVAGEATSRARATPRVPSALRDARTCYDHLAGRLAVALADSLVARGVIVLTDEAGEVTETGRGFLRGLGVTLDSGRSGRRVYCRPCLDWSERRPHLGGIVGIELFDRLLALDWIRRGAEHRVIVVTPKGRTGFAETFGLSVF